MVNIILSNLHVACTMLKFNYPIHSSRKSVGYHAFDVSFGPVHSFLHNLELVVGGKYIIFR
jgi:hypothetical protein